MHKNLSSVSTQVELCEQTGHHFPPKDLLKQRKINIHQFN